MRAAARALLLLAPLFAAAAAAAGREPVLSQVALPHGSKLILVVRDGKAEVPDDTMQLEEGDSVLAILEPGKEDEFRRVLVRD